MTIVSLPSGLLVRRQDFGKRDFDMEFGNSDSGASQVAVLGPPRLSCSLVSDDSLDLAQAAVWRALVFSLKGRVNHLAVYDLLNAAPRGTMRGSLTVLLAAAAGADTLTITGGASQANKTLLVGDWIGVNQAGNNRQLLHVQADATANASGVIVVSVQPNLRVAVAAGSPVVWDRPTCLMKRNDASSSWASTGAVQGGFNLELMEHWF